MLRSLSGLSGKYQGGIDPSQLFGGAVDTSGPEYDPAVIESEPDPFESKLERIRKVARAVADMEDSLSEFDEPQAPEQPKFGGLKTLKTKEGWKNLATHKGAGGVPMWTHGLAILAEILADGDETIDESGRESSAADWGAAVEQSQTNIDRDEADVAAQRDARKRQRAGTLARMLPELVKGAGLFDDLNPDEARGGVSPQKIRTWEAIQNEPWFSQLPADRQGLIRDRVLGIADKGATTPENVRAMEWATQQPWWADMSPEEQERYRSGLLNVPIPSAGKPDDSVQQFATERYVLYTTKPGKYPTARDPMGIREKTLSPDEAMELVKRDVEGFRRMRSDYPSVDPTPQPRGPRPSAAGPAGAPDMSGITMDPNADPQVSAIVRQYPEIADILAAAPKGTEISFPPGFNPAQPGGQPMPQPIPTPGMPPQPGGAPMPMPIPGPGGPAGPGAMPMGAPGGGALPSLRPGLTDPSAPMFEPPGGAGMDPARQGTGFDPSMIERAVQGYRNLVQKYPAEREAILEDFIAQWGFDPAVLELPPER